FQDYPNCAEGIVDMFFRPKGVSAEEFRKFNSPTVLLLDTPRRNLRSGERAECKLLVSRFEDEPATATLQWKINRGNETLASGSQQNIRVTSGSVQDVATIKWEAGQTLHAERLTLSAELTDSTGKTDNAWDLWVFPTNFLAETSYKIRHHGF